MTNVHAHWVWLRLSECIFVIDRPYTDPIVKGLRIYVIDHSQWQMCKNTVFDLDSVSAYLSLTMVNDKCGCTLSLIKTQWVHICHWSQSMTNVHEHCVWFRLSECIFVIDRPYTDSIVKGLRIYVIDHSQWQMCMNTVCDLDSVSASLSFIAVNDKCARTLSVI